MNRARGRPLGLLTAWLAAGGHKPDMRAHKDMMKPKEQQPGDLELLSLERREAGRKWLTDNGLTSLLGKEREQRTGEPAEPVGVA